MQSWTRIFHLVGSLVGCGVILVYLKPILLPFVVAVFLQYLVRPCSEFVSANLCCCCRRFSWRREQQRLAEQSVRTPLLPTGTPSLRRHGSNVGEMLVDEVHHATQALPQWVGVSVAIFLAITMLITVLVLMSSSIVSLGSRLDAYQQRAHHIWTIASFQLKPYGLELSDAALPSKAISVSISAHLAPVVNALGALLNDLVLIFLFLVFLLMAPAPQRSSLRKRIDDSVSRYLVLKSLICSSMACLTFVILSVLDFPLALFLSLATFGLTFIPNLGPLVAVFLPLPICLLDASVSTGTATLAIGLPAIAHVLTGNLLEPHLFGSQFQISPVVILLSLGVWSVLWGPVGAALAVPLTSIVRVTCADLIQGGAASEYIVLLNSLLEGKFPLDDAVGRTDAPDLMDSHAPLDESAPTPAKRKPTIRSTDADPDLSGGVSSDSGVGKAASVLSDERYKAV